MSSVVFAIIFSLEAAMRIVANGFNGPTREFTTSKVAIRVVPYWSTGWNRLDFTIVLISWIDIFVTLTTDDDADFEFLKALRVMRAFRALRMLNKLKGLRVLVPPTRPTIPSYFERRVE
eukprot:COSAG05_NODE_1222_length_5472_cov_7.765033_2_plen_119_part_00